MKKALWVTLAAVLCLAACKPELVVTVGNETTKVRLHRVETRAIKQELSAFGTISFKEKTDLAPLVDGVVSELKLDEGDRVRRGQVLVRLRNPQLELRRKQAEASLGLAQSALSLAEAQLWAGELQVEARLIGIAKAEEELAQKEQELVELERVFKNKQALYEAGGATEESISNLKLSLAAQKTAYQSLKKDLEVRRIGLRDSDLQLRKLPVPRDEAARAQALVQLNTSTLRAELEGAKARLASARTELEAADTLLAELQVKAPQDAIVGAKQVELGEYVQAASKILTLINTDSMYAVFPVPEEQAVRLNEGLSVSVSLDAFPNEEFQARLDLVSPVIDSRSGAVTVKALMGNARRDIKPGMFARVRVGLGEAMPQAVVPESCLVRQEGKQARVLSVVSGRVVARDVLLLDDLGAEWTVQQGLQAGDLLVDEPSPLLQEGSEVAE